jgi:hypothetical protein
MRRYEFNILIRMGLAGSAVMIGRKKPTRSMFLSSISITPKEMTDLPLLASVAVINRVFAMIVPS